MEKGELKISLDFVTSCIVRPICYNCNLGGFKNLAWENVACPKIWTILEYSLKGSYVYD